MTVERWSRLKELFEAALEQRPSDRLVYVARVCADDNSLRGEIEHLLKQHELAGDLPSGGGPHTPASRTFAADQIVAGRFRIVRFIGQGGMGEVYEALDNEIKARIALKTLRPSISGDPRATARLIQEIQLARRVTHPNV